MIAETYLHNGFGNVTQMTDGRGIVTNYTYDNAGRMKTKTFPAATAENVTYTWDSTAGGNKGKGRLTSVADESGSMAWVYDERGNVVSETRVIQGKSYTTAYAYTANDDISQITYPSGRIVTIARNAIGRISSIKTQKNAGAAVNNVATTFTWKPMAELIDKFTYGNGLTFDAGYDLDYRLTSLKVQDGGTDRISLSYAYGDGLNLTAITDHVTAANSVSLGYVKLNRLYSAAGPWGQKVFSYDRTGNLTQEQSTVSGTTTARTLAYPSTSNRISSETTNGTTTRIFTYDGAGNALTGLPAGASYALTYNKRNRPAGLKLNGATAATYLFNAGEQLVSRTLLPPLVPQANTTHYLYDLDGHLIAEASGTSASNAVITREYIWLNDMPIAVVDNVDTASPLTRYVHTDHLLRPIMMTGGAKGTVWSATWTPWGTAQTLSGSAIQNLRFPGQYFLIEQGLHHNWHRFYDPTTGRYTQPDPLGFPDGPSRYAYAGNSPLMNVDPDGRCGPVCAALIRAGIGAAAGLAYEWWTNGECADWKDYTRSALIGAGFGAAGGPIIGIAGRLAGPFLGIGSKLAGSKIGGAAGAAGSKLPQIIQNKIAGDAFRDELAAVLRAAGRDVETEVYKWTPFGKRFIDIEVSLSGKVLGGIETKVGSSQVTWTQQLKDWWLKVDQGYIVNIARD
jgi:RHS repeat-associated protein